jgi:hypothetical protein
MRRGCGGRSFHLSRNPLDRADLRKERGVGEDGGSQMMCGAPDIRATQMSLTLTLSRQRARELEGRVNWIGEELGRSNRKEKGERFQSGLNSLVDMF